MSDDTAAEKAIAELHGKEFNGRALTVNEARPKTENRRGSSQSSAVPEINLTGVVPRTSVVRLV